MFHTLLTTKILFRAPVNLNPDIFEKAFFFYTNRPYQTNPSAETASFKNRSLPQSSLFLIRLVY